MAEAVQFLLLLPAALFFFSVFARGAFPPATGAEQFVRWFETRMWTLWLLLLALLAPARVDVTGRVPRDCVGATRSPSARLRW